MTLIKEREREAGDERARGLVDECIQVWTRMTQGDDEHALKVYQAATAKYLFLELTLRRFANDAIDGHRWNKG